MRAAGSKTTSGIWIGQASVSDPFASESLATSALHILRIESYAGFTSLDPVNAQPNFSFEPIEISLIRSEGLNAVLGRKVEGPFLNLMTQKFVENLDLARRFRRHRRAPFILNLNLATRFQSPNSHATRSTVAGI
jgi:hypothetical protein